MGQLEYYTEELTDELTISVTINLVGYYGFEIILIECNDPAKSLGFIISFLNKVLINCPLELLQKETNLVFHDGVSSSVLHLFTETAIDEYLTEFLVRAKVDPTTKIMQYHPPLPRVLDKIHLEGYFPGYFPLDTVSDIINIHQNDYRLLIH